MSAAAIRTGADRTLELLHRLRRCRSRHAILPSIHERVASQLAVVREWIEPNETFEWVEPQAGAVCFPRIRTDVDIDRFYRVLFEEHGTYVGGGHWFDQDRRFFRLGFAWPTTEELARGLRALDSAAAAARRPAGSLLGD